MQWIKLLHKLGMTNLSDKQVEQYYYYNKNNIVNFKLIIIDIILFIIALSSAYLLRFDFELNTYFKLQLLHILPIFLLTKFIIYLSLGLFRRMRYFNLSYLLTLGKACMLSFLLNYIIINIIYGPEGYYRSIIFMDGILTFILSGTIRSIDHLFYISKAPEKYFLIIGAGKAGQITAREIRENLPENCRVIGFLDDDPSKWGNSLRGLRVFGNIDLLPKIVEKEKVDEVLIAIPSATGTQMRRIVEICKKCGVRFQTLPGLGALVTSTVNINTFRDIKYEDLLRNAPIDLNAERVSRYLKGKKVLVTGAGGSIGSELCRQMIRFELNKLILLDASESNLFNIKRELEYELNFHNYESILGKVHNRQLMNALFLEYRPDLVFHAAALKHVPMLEENPWEAIFNNVLGSQVVMELSKEYHVERFVLVSTNKAEHPTNVMGASKRLTELILQSLDGNGSYFIAVRFGNLLGSSGSLISLWRRQMEVGGPITVAHPECTRAFMTNSEAAQLIIKAGALKGSGKIFVLEMGPPIKVLNMAEELLRLSGKKLGKDIEIIFTGLREGDKLHEELITQSEDKVSTNYEKIMVLRSNDMWKGMNKEEFKKSLYKDLEELYQIATTYDANAIKRKLSQILPEYTPQLNVKSVFQAKQIDVAQSKKFKLDYA